MNQSEKQFALDLAEAGAKRAAAHAGAAWHERATLALHVYLARRIEEQFTAEDVRDWSTQNMATPDAPDRRAWGLVFMAAAREKRIRKIGYVPHRDPARHNGISTLWERV